MCFSSCEYFSISPLALQRTSFQRRSEKFKFSVLMKNILPVRPQFVNFAVTTLVTLPGVGYNNVKF